MKPIPFNEKLPPYSTYLLIYRERLSCEHLANDFAVAPYGWRQGIWYDKRVDTHWLPLPLEPKEKK